MTSKYLRTSTCVIMITLLLTGCSLTDTNNSAPDTEAQVTSEISNLDKINAEICEEMKVPRSLIYGVGTGWAIIDGKVTGFGPSGKEERVVVDVDSTIYDSSIEKWSKLYGDMVYVEAVTAIMDELSAYTDLVDQDEAVVMTFESSIYSYGNSKARLLITNQTDSDITFNDQEIYEKFLSGEWHTIYKDYYSDDIAYNVGAYDTTDYEVLLPTYNLDFEAGTYRIIKVMKDRYYSAEFSIE